MYGFARRETKTGKFIGKEWHIMLITPSRVEMLNTLVHEINECEIFNLLRTEMLKDIGGDHRKIYIKVNKKLKKKYPWLFNTMCPELEITHIISPYGQDNCAIPRRSSRLIWQKNGKR
jgi:hypothetical protein